MASLGFFAVGHSRAANVYWDGVTGNWSDLTKWSTLATATTPDPTVVPTTGDIATFNITGINGVQIVYLDGNQAISGLVFNNTASTTLLGGNALAAAINSLTLGGNINTGVGQVILGGTATQGTDVNLALTANSAWTVGTGGLVVNNSISGAFSITKTGGLLTLNGANSYSGGTTISGAVLANNSAALGTGSVTINSGAGNQLQLGNGVNITNSINVLGGGATSQGVLWVPTGNATFSGNLAITGTTQAGAYFATAAPTSRLSIVGDNTITSNQPITVRLGYVNFMGAQNYTTGTTAGNAGTMLQFGKKTSMPAIGAVTLVSGNTLVVNAGGTGEFDAGTATGAGSISGLLAGVGGQGAAVTLPAGSSLGIDTTNATSAVTFSNAFTSTNNIGFVKLGTGTLGLAGGGTYSGNGIGGFPFIVRQGKVILDGLHTVNGEAVVGGVLTTANGAAGYDAQLQVNSGTLAITGYLSVGRGNGIGGVSSDLIVNNNAVINTASFSAGFNVNAANLPKGSITMNGTSALNVSSTNAFNVGESAGSNFTMTLNDTSSVSLNPDGYIGNAGTGKLVVNGGTFSIGTTATRWLTVGNTGNGQIDINSGSLRLLSGTSIKLSRGANTGANTINQNGGDVSFYSDTAGATLGGAGALDMMLAGSATSTNTYNLNGGTLNVPAIIATTNNGTKIFNFNGGIIRPTGSSTNFFNMGTSNSFAQVRNGGGTIDTRGFAITVAQGLIHSTVAGDNATDGGLTLTGGGSVVLNGVNTYTGATNITANTGVFVGKSLAGPVNLTSGSLFGSGTIGATTVATGFNTLGNGTTGSLTFASLNFAGSATANLTIDSSAALAVTGALTTTGANGKVTLNITKNGGAWGNGANSLISFGSFTGNISDFILGNISGTALTNRQTLGGLILSGNNIALQINGDSPKWTGLDNGNWQGGTTGALGNWKLITAGTATDYIEGDTVLFDDTAAGTTNVVISNGYVNPTSTTFNNNTKNYTLTSTGAGIGSGLFTKSGAATLTIATYNNFASASFNGGGLFVGTEGALGIGSVTIGPGAPKTLDNVSGDFITLQTTTQAWNDDFTFLGTSSMDMGFGDVTVGGTGTRTVTVAANTLSVGEIKATGLGFAKLGNGTLVLSSVGANTAGSVVGGNLQVEGTLQINRTDSAASNSGDLVAATLSGSGTITNGAAVARWLFVNGASTNSTFSGSLINGGTGGLGLDKQGTGTLTISGANNYTDATTVDNGVLIINGANSGAGTNATVNVGKLVLGNTSALGTTSTIRLNGNNVSTLVFATDGNDNVNSLSMGTTTVATIVSDRATAGAGVNHTMTTPGGAGLGGGTLNITSGANVTSGAGRITFSQFTLGAGSVQTTTLNPTTANVTIVDVFKANNDFSQTLGLGGTSQDNLVTGIISNGTALTGTNAISIAKTDVSTWTLTGNNTYTGTTTISGGVLNVGNGGSSGSLGTGAVINNAVLNVNKAGTVALSSIAGTGSTNVLAGTLIASGTTGSITVANNASAAIGNGTTGQLSTASLTFNGAGAVTTNIAGTGSAAILVSGLMATTPANGKVTVNAFSPNWSIGTYDLIGFGSFTGSISDFTLGSLTGGRVTAGSLVLDGNNVAISITGLEFVKWTGALSSEWSTATLSNPKNWKLSNAGTATDFISGDKVIFDDTATNTNLDITSANVNTSGAIFQADAKAFTLNSSGGFGIASGPLTKAGNGTLTINNANTFAGGTTFTGGRLNLGNASALGAGKLTIDTGAPKTLDTSAGSFILNGITSQAWNDDFTFAGTSDLDLGSGAVTLAGAGTDRTVNVVNNKFSVGEIKSTSVGLIKQGAGTLVLTSIGAATAGSVIAGTLNVAGGMLQMNRDNATGNTFAGDVVVGALAGTGTVINGAGDTRWLYINGTTSTATTFSGILANGGSGALGLSNGGNGTLTLAGVNTYTDVTALTGGVLAFAGAGSIANSSEYRLSAAGILAVNSSSRLNTTAPININSDGGAVGATGRLELSADTNLVNPINLAPRNDPDGSDAIRSVSGNNTLSGPITIITGGNQARIRSDAGLLTLSGSITTTAAAARNLYLQGAGNGVVSGVIFDNATSSAGTIILHKEGTGTWSVTGANTYTGGTVVDGGTLVVGDGNTSGNLGGGSITTNATLAFNRSDAVTISTPIAGTGGVSNIGTGPLTLTGASNYAGSTNAANGSVTFSGGVTHKTGALRGNAVAITAGTSVVSQPATGASKLASLTLAGSTGNWTSKLDLTNNALILTAASAGDQATLITQLKDQITSGKAGGTWTGNGITSSTMTSSSFAAANSLAIADAGDLNLTAFGGQTGLDANSTIVTVAHNGDATLDGKVDAFDLNRLAANWQQTGKLWSAGDFTGDGKVDAFDLNTLASNWQFGVGGSLEAALASFPEFSGVVAAVPEPASLALLALGGAALLGRRRRK